MTRSGRYAPHTKRKPPLLRSTTSRAGLRNPAHNRTGVNTGEVATGGRGDRPAPRDGRHGEHRRRLEQAAGPNEVLIGELTWRLVRDAVKIEPIGRFELKGKARRRGVSTARCRGGHRGCRARRAPAARGRTEELAFLLARFRTAVDERKPTMATVMATRESQSRRDPRSRRLGCERRRRQRPSLSYGDGTTFWPVIEAVRDAAGISPDDGPDVGLASYRLVDSAVVERFASILGLSQEPFSVDELFGRCAAGSRR